MDFGKLLSGLGGKLLRQALGIAMKEGAKRMGSSKSQGAQDRFKTAQSRDSQKRMQQIMRIGRRFWK